MSPEQPDRILIVDDTPTNIEVLLGMLEDDYDLSFATSGAQALDLLGRSRIPDLILLDVMMPEMDGYAVCAALKANPATRSIPVIFVTAKTDADSETHALSAGGVDFIHKPVNQAVVRARVALHLELEHRTRALRAANAELQEHRDHLEELVHERTRELAAARDAAEGASRAKSAFLANMGHELLTPMNQIMGQTYLLKQTAGDGRVQERAARIEQACQRLLRLVTDLLDLARVEGGAVRLELGDIDLSELCESVERPYRELGAAKGLVLVREIDPALPAGVRGDRKRLEQILTSLLDNAVKFSEQGRILLGICQEERRDGAVTVRFEVRDQGVGMSPEIQASVFDAFYQGEDAANRRYEGTGLGLPLCKRLVALMAGEMGVESTPGSGTTIWLSLRLPISETSAALAGEPVADPPQVGREQAAAAAAELARLLEAGDATALSRYAEHPSLYAPVLQERLQPFQDALQAFDFELAHRLLLERQDHLP